MNTPRLFARPQREMRGWNSELALRYGAATLVTLIALAAAQLVLPTQFALILGAITLLGLPVSLWMRFHDLRVGGVQVPRPLWNALTVTASGAASAVFLRAPLLNLLGAAQGGINDSVLLRVGAVEPMLLLVQLFLVFAAFRSFSLISDKDATLATVPSFSVLLLLIPISPNIEVVSYFLLWTLVATMLFALDHRSEIHAMATATVPAPAPGQEVGLAARSLAGVLAIALVAAIALSGFLTARDPHDGSSSDSAIALLASRLTQLSLQSDDTSTRNGPERQIDFSSNTSLPTRALLWEAQAVTSEGISIKPTYWRLFTLSNYDGSIWSQNNGNVRVAKRVSFTDEQWPAPQLSLSDNSNLERERVMGIRPKAGGEPLQSAERATPAQQFQTRPSFQTRQFVPFDVPTPKRRRGNPDSGFLLARAQPKMGNSFGNPRKTVIYQIKAMRTALGFLPLLPAPTTLILPNNDSDSLRVRSDGGVDVSIIAAGQAFQATSEVPPLPEYGDPRSIAPLEKVAPAKNAAAPQPNLSQAERAQYLALPRELPARVRQFARTATRTASPNSSNYARARLLARATQSGAIYTLRPPSIPVGRDATDFFLFESRRGYCTYFAGALTVLCRAQGIPARVVSGFVAADEPEDKSLISIRDANAHAWTEIWIENWGWAVVDATPPGDRGDNAPTLLENWSDLAGAQLDNFLRWSIAHWPRLLGGGALLFLAFGAWRFRRGIARRLGRVVAPDSEAQRREIVADYAHAARVLSRRFRPRHAWETPDEWLQAAHSDVPQLPLEPLQTLTSLYVSARFSPRALARDAALRARQARESIVWAKTPRKRVARQSPHLGKIKGDG